MRKCHRPSGRNTIRDHESSLPCFVPAEAPTFVWGEREASSVVSELSRAYEEVVHWKKNCFVVPFGRQGKLFVAGLVRLFRAYGEGSALECVALKAVFVALVLLLQTPHPNSKPKDHNECLKRRLDLWLEGDFGELIWEGRTIQKRLRKKGDKAKVSNLARI